MKKFWLAALLALGVVLPAAAQGGGVSVSVTSDCSTLTLVGVNDSAAVVTLQISAFDEVSGSGLISSAELVVEPGISKSRVIGLGGTVNGVIRWDVTGTSVTGARVLTRTGSINCVQPLNVRDTGRPFRVFCSPDGAIIFSQLDARSNAAVTLNTTVGQLASALIRAAATGANQPANANTAGLSVWALTSGELQAVYRGPLGNYDFVFPTNDCGGIDISGPIQIAIGGSAPVVELPPAPALPGVTVPTTPPTTVGSGGCVAIAPNTRAHVVQRGQTLFRIGRAYNVPWRTLASINGLFNPNRIFPGQCLQIP